MKTALACALLSAAAFLALASLSRSVIERERTAPSRVEEPPAVAEPDSPAAAIAAPQPVQEEERLYERHEIRGRESEFEPVRDAAPSFSRAIHVLYRKKKTRSGP